MSRNYELIRQAEEAGVFAGLSVPAALHAMPPEERVNGRNGHSNGNGKHNGNGSFDLRTRAEITRLVHTLFLTGMNAPHHVLFCGVDEGDASGRLCVAAGEVLASEVPVPVCVVDAKMRAPSLQRLFASEKHPASRENGPGRLARQVGSNLWSLSLESIQPHGDVAHSAERWRASLRVIRQDFGYVLIDAEPVGRPADAAALGQATDGVVLVLEANATRRVAALSAKEALEAAGVRLLGTVLNDRTFPIPEKLYRKL